VQIKTNASVQSLDGVCVFKSTEVRRRALKM